MLTTERKIGAMLLFIGLSSLIFGCASREETHNDLERITSLKQQFERPNPPEVMTVAHRACWSVAPENSIAALNHCIDIGVDVVEIDVQLTADRKLVVFHDQTLERMTGSPGVLSEYTLGELQKLNLFERDGMPAYLLGKRIETYHKIPTLREFFEAAKGQMLINLEIKANESFSFEETFYAAVELAKELAIEDHVLWKIPTPSRNYGKPIVNGFAGDTNRSTKSTSFVSNLDIEGLSFVMPIINNTERSLEQKLADYGTEQAINAFELITTDLAYWKLKGDKIIGSNDNRYMAIALKPSWSGGLSDDVALKEPKEAWGRLIDIGFNMIMTDRPEQLIAYLESRKQN